MGEKGKPTFDPDEAFIVTVGVPRAGKQIHCRRALTALHHAGYRAAPTSDEAITALAHQLEDDPSEAA